LKGANKMIVDVHIMIKNITAIWNRFTASVFTLPCDVFNVNLKHWQTIWQFKVNTFCVTLSDSWSNVSNIRPAFELTHLFRDILIFYSLEKRTAGWDANALYRSVRSRLIFYSHLKWAKRTGRRLHFMCLILLLHF
jgi:hypothetical protein